MTPAEREAFLAEVHVAVVTVADDDGRGPLAIPLWYDYRPGGEIILVTDGNSRKAQLIRKAGRVTVCAQTQEMPYRYASVEGPVTAIEDTVTVEQRWELARRYLGHEGADGYRGHPGRHRPHVRDPHPPRALADPRLHEGRWIGSATLPPRITGNPPHGRPPIRPPVGAPLTLGAAVRPWPFNLG